jgi:hypothetical protein
LPVYVRNAPRAGTTKSASSTNFEVEPAAGNTATADKPVAKGLSGLARAFFYAGAGAIVVSLARGLGRGRSLDHLRFKGATEEPDDGTRRGSPLRYVSYD